MRGRGVRVGAGYGSRAPGSRWGPEGGSHAGLLGYGQGGYSAEVVQGLGGSGQGAGIVPEPGVRVLVRALYQARFGSECRNAAKAQGSDPSTRIVLSRVWVRVRE